jgi:membrane-associated PAP2 superfamily phosphatase
MPRSLQQFDLYHLLGLAITGLLMADLVPVAGPVDQWLSRPWVNASGYYLRDNWWLVHIGHQLLKDVVILIALLHAILWLKLYRQRASPALRQICSRVILGMLSSVLMIGWLKSHSAHACPWSMLQIHATQIDWLKAYRVGKCFPGGHASAGFSLLILYFAYRPVYPQWARRALFLALLLGISMSVVQMLRGAHFLSHNLWSWWCSWLIDYLLYALWQADGWQRLHRIWQHYRQAATRKQC